MFQQILLQIRHSYSWFSCPHHEFIISLLTATMTTGIPSMIVLCTVRIVPGPPSITTLTVGILSVPEIIVNIAARWNILSNTIYDAAITASGKREIPNQEWFNANLHVMVPVIEIKREALLAYKHNSCEKTRCVLISARSISQRTARRCANDY